MNENGHHFKHNESSVDEKMIRQRTKMHNYISFYGTKINGLFDYYNNIMINDNNNQYNVRLSYYHHVPYFESLKDRLYCNDNLT